MILFHTLWNDILPLLVFIGAGWMLDSKFKLQISTYTRFITYIVMPCFVFFSVYKSHLGETELIVLPAAFLLLALLLVLSGVLSKFTAGNAGDFVAASSFCNSGYLGAVLMFLLFSHAPYLVDGKAAYLDDAMGIMALLMTFMNIAFHGIGGVLISNGKKSIASACTGSLKAPVLYAAVLAVLIKSTPFTLEGTFLYPVFHHFTGAFVVLTTISIGVLAHRYHKVRLTASLWGSALLKLFISPAIALGIIYGIGGFSPLASQVFLLYAAIPTAISLILFDDTRDSLVHPVVFQMLLSFFTLTLAICLGQILFPVAA